MLLADPFESVQLPSDNTELPDSGMLNFFGSAFVFVLTVECPVLLFSQFDVVPSFFVQHLA